MTDENLPPLRTVVKNIVQSSVEVIKGIPNGILSDDETQQHRMDICRACEFFIVESEKCQKCGCFMPRKTALKNISCPIEKW